jgi:hypothetical protein
MTDIPIVNASTSFSNKRTGETIIIRVNQVRWYGKKLKMSLINPYPMRHYGWTVSDDSTHIAREIGISGENFAIPFSMKGTTTFFNSRVPTR